MSPVFCRSTIFWIFYFSMLGKYLNIAIWFRISPWLLKRYQNSIRPFSIGLRAFFLKWFGGFCKNVLWIFEGTFLCIVKHIRLNIGCVRLSESAILFWIVPGFQACFKNPAISLDKLIGFNHILLNTDQHIGSAGSWFLRIVFFLTRGKGLKIKRRV